MDFCGGPPVAKGSDINNLHTVPLGISSLCGHPKDYCLILGKSKFNKTVFMYVCMYVSTLPSKPNATVACT